MRYDGETVRAFLSVLSSVQEHISGNYPAVLNTVTSDEPLIGSYVEKYLRDTGQSVAGMSGEELVRDIVNEMTGYGFLTGYLTSDSLEEININGWDDIAVRGRDGETRKLEERFFSPAHAEDILKRLLRHSGMIIDNARPWAQGHLPGNARITVLKHPLVDQDRGISASIRILRPASVSTSSLIEDGVGTPEMISFLVTCAGYGVPFVIVGATGSGKTTLLNAVLGSMPDGMRIFTIESGARELSLLKRNTDGEVLNNVVHTLSRPSEEASFDISQEDLVTASLRFDPDLIVVGEMRDVECSAAVEASLTGHTVLSTVHAGPGAAAHMRIALLCQKRFPIDFDTSLYQAAEAFPVIVYTHRLGNNERKILDISECVIGDGGMREYRRLYGFTVEKNLRRNGRTEVTGRFSKYGTVSDSLRERLMRSGIPDGELSKYTGPGNEEEK